MRLSRLRRLPPRICSLPRRDHDSLKSIWTKMIILTWLRAKIELILFTDLAMKYHVVNLRYRRQRVHQRVVSSVLAPSRLQFGAILKITSAP